MKYKLKDPKEYIAAGVDYSNEYAYAFGFVGGALQSLCELIERSQSLETIKAAAQSQAALCFKKIEETTLNN